jgi:hypothetical protein
MYYPYNTRHSMYNVQQPNPINPLNYHTRYVSHSPPQMQINNELISQLINILQTGQGQSINVLYDDNDPQATLISDPNQVQQLHQLLGIPNQNSVPQLTPQNIEIMANPETITATTESNPQYTIMDETTYGGMVPTAIYPDPPRAFVSFYYPKYINSMCTIRIFGRKIKFNCPRLTKGRVPFFATVTYPRITPEYIVSEIKSCLRYAEGVAKGAGVTAFIYTPGEVFAKAAAALTAAWAAFQIAIAECVSGITDFDRYKNLIRFKIWYDIQ